MISGLARRGVVAMNEPQFLIICFDRCPYCGVGGERDIPCIPFGGTNHQCSHCKNIYSVRADGFSKSGKVPTLDDITGEESDQ